MSKKQETKKENNFHIYLVLLSNYRQFVERTVIRS
jgi:hypothetical protein